MFGLIKISMLKSWWLVKWYAFMLLQYVGMRDRLRCPGCNSVGTWKPHGGIWEGRNCINPKRWLCKWCGLYDDLAGSHMMAVINKEKNYWDFIQNCPDGKTTLELINGIDGYQGTNPWMG